MTIYVIAGASDPNCRSASRVQGGVEFHDADALEARHAPEQNDETEPFCAQPLIVDFSFSGFPDRFVSMRQSGDVLADDDATAVTLLRIRLRFGCRFGPTWRINSLRPSSPG